MAIQPISSICFIGAGYVGGPTAAVVAKECPHIQVTVADCNADRIEAWQSNQLPVSEPGLLDIVRIARDGIRRDKGRNLHFTTAVAESINDADMIVISVDTPTKTAGTGAGYSLSLSRLEEVITSIARASTSHKIVVEKSTVPVGTGQVVRETLAHNARPGVTFDVVSNPEFLAEGAAIQNLLYPDRIIIGSLETPSGKEAAKALVDVYATWVPRAQIITMNLFSAELSKLAANALLAQRVSSVNALSVLCEETGADIKHVAQAVRSDSRIGPHMLQPSFGFGGSCFKKDVRSLIYLCRCLHLEDVAAYWEGILEINERQKSRAVARIVARFHNSMDQKKIAVLGFAFKAGTGDTRESCAIDLVKGLLCEGAVAAIYDPCVKESRIRKDLGIDEETKMGSHKRVQVCASGDEACEGAHAVLVATNWEMFRVQPRGYASTHDWSRVAQLMKYPRLVFGSSEYLDTEALQEMGFSVEVIGRRIGF
ncbi:UDP-GlcDH 4 [Aspergillus navahoensis]